MRASQERPADLYLASLLIVGMKSRGADDAPSPGVNDSERATGCQRILKKSAKDRFFVAIADRMLFPDERISSDSVEFIPIFRAKRPELDQLALQNRLRIE